MPLERERAKVKRMQTSVILCIENRVLCVFFSLLSTQQLCQLCYHSLGKSQGWHTNTPRLRKRLWNPASEKSLRPLQPHGSISAMRQLLVSMLPVRRGCHQHLRRVHNKSRKHYRDLQRTLLRRGNSTNAVPLYRTAYRMEHHQHYYGSICLHRMFPCPTKPNYRAHVIVITLSKMTSWSLC